MMGGGVANHYLKFHWSAVAREFILRHHHGDQNIDTEFVLDFDDHWINASDAAKTSGAALDAYMATTPAATWWAARPGAWRGTVRDLMIAVRG